MKDTEPSDSILLERSVIRLSSNKQFLASVFRDIANGEPNLKEIAKELNGSLEAIIKLGLCQRPFSTSSTFRNNVHQIAQHTGIDEIKLLSLLKKAEVLSIHREATGAQLLAAARDAEPPDTEEEDK